MLDSLINHHEATITRAQSTYLEAAVSSRSFRIDYRGKVEFLLKPGAQGALTQATDHPLLWDYNSPCDTVYLSSPAPDPMQLVGQLQGAVAMATQGWRSLDRYLFLRNKTNTLALLAHNLASGSGLLVQSAPAPVVEAVLAACQQYGVTTYIYTRAPVYSMPAVPPVSVLFIGACYVIAREFKVQELGGRDSSS
jgi:hypothetical protein